MCVMDWFPKFALMETGEPREFFVSFLADAANSYKCASFFILVYFVRIRDLHSDRIGQLLTITGTVTRTSMVRPELVSGTFQCGECQEIYKDVEQQFVYTAVKFNFLALILACAML